MPSAVGGLVGGLFGGSTPSPPNVQTFQPSGTQSFDQLYQNLLKSNVSNNPYSTYAPQAAATFNQQYGNPYAGGYQTAANSAGTAFNTVGNNAVGASTPITNAAVATLPAATTALNMGFDPQGDLYRRTLQQLTDTANVQNAGAGTTSSPYGSSVVDNAVSNFNIDWQNNQLQRALQALSGYTGAVQGAGSAATTAGNLGTAGAEAINNAGAVPFGAANIITGNQSTALDNLLKILGNAGSSAFTQQNLGDLLSYLNLGAGQSNVQADLSLENYANALKAAQASQQGLGSLVSGGLSALGGAADAFSAGGGIPGFLAAAFA